jgi:hypothetical protein
VFRMRQIRMYDQRQMLGVAMLVGGGIEPTHAFARG